MNRTRWGRAGTVGRIRSTSSDTALPRGTACTNPGRDACSARWPVAPVHAGPRLIEHGRILSQAGRPGRRRPQIEISGPAEGRKQTQRGGRGRAAGSDQARAPNAGGARSGPPPRARPRRAGGRGSSGDPRWSRSIAGGRRSSDRPARPDRRTTRHTAPPTSDVAGSPGAAVSTGMGRRPGTTGCSFGGA